MFVVMLICTLFWVLLSDGNLQSWLLGVPAILCSTWFILRRGAQDESRLKLTALIRFLPWFLWESFRGGVEVSKLAFSRRGIQYAETFEFHCRLQNARAEVFFVNCINMLPGTATIDWSNNTIEIHTISSVEKSRLEILDVQRRVAALFSLQLSDEVSESECGTESTAGYRRGRITSS